MFKKTKLLTELIVKVQNLDKNVQNLERKVVTLEQGIVQLFKGSTQEIKAIQQLYDELHDIHMILKQAMELQQINQYFMAPGSKSIN